METLITVGQILEMIAKFLFNQEECKIEFTNEYHEIRFTPNGDHNRAKKLVYENNGHSKLYYSAKSWEEIKIIVSLIELVNQKYRVFDEIKYSIPMLSFPDYISEKTLSYRKDAKNLFVKEGLNNFKQFRDFCKEDF